jgi:hypothetical protein
MQLAGPDINFIEASENFGNLESAMEYYANHDDEAEEIARNSYDTFARRYLTPAAVSNSTLAARRRGLITATGYLLLAEIVLGMGFSSSL